MKLTDGAEMLDNGMFQFHIVRRYLNLPERRTPYPEYYPGAVYACTLEEAEFLLEFSAVKYVAIEVVVQTVDAGHIGGQLGMLCNKFDPRKN